MEAYARLIKLKPGSDTWVRGAGAEGRLLLDLQVDA